MKHAVSLILVSLLLVAFPVGVMAQTVQLHDGDARYFDDPPDVIAYANVNQVSPPSGVTITDSGGLWRYYEWIALTQQGQWIQATYAGTNTTAVGVQFWGDAGDGWARVLVDGTEVWTGSTYGTDSNWPGGAYVKYLEISGLTPGPHTIRVENMGIAGAGGGDDVCIYFFGFSSATEAGSKVYLPIVMGYPFVASRVIRTNEEGVVEHPSGAQIYVPRGAVPLNLAGEEGEMLFTIERGSPEYFGVPSTPPPGMEFVGDMYSMGPEGFIFEIPIRATMPLPEGFDLGQYDVQMFDYDRFAGKWTSVGGRVSEDGTTLSADVLHLCANMLIAQQWSGRGHGAIMFDAIPGYSFKLCIESYTLRYPDWDGDRFNARNRFRSIMRRDAYGCPPDGKQYWRLPQGTYTLSIGVYRHGDDPLRTPEYLGYFQRTVTIDRPHWDWQSGGHAPDYEFAVPFGSFEIDPSRLTPGRPPCMGTPTPSVGVGAINIRLDWHAEADLDLWVIDPCGNKIYWYQPQQTCQGSLGQLDSDNWCYSFVLGRPENIFWKTNPPVGTYKIYVDYYEDCANAGTVYYTVRWWVDGNAYSKHGTISPPASPGAAGDEVLVTTFTH